MKKFFTFYTLKIPFVRKNFETTKSSKFKGTLKLIVNDNGFIYFWEISFSHLAIDLYTTPRWIKDKTPVFIHREEIFKLIDLKQEARPSKKHNKIINLSKAQIEKVENYLNDRNRYFSTIKNIVGITKGNNPSGEWKNPKAAEMIIDNSELELKYKNFLILIDDLILNHKAKDNELKDFLKYVAREWNLKQYINKNEIISKLLGLMQQEKVSQYFFDYINQLKEHKKKNLKIKGIIDNETLKYRSKFSKKIEELAKVKKFPFHFIGNNIQYEKAHIIPVAFIKEQIASKAVQLIIKEKILDHKKVFENPSIKKLLAKIEDVNNFLPLIGEVHRQFDKLNFSYDENGKIFFKDKKSEEKLNMVLFSGDNAKFKKIDEFFLNGKRIKYLIERNEIFFKE